MNSKDAMYANILEVVLVIQNTVVSRTRCAEQTGVALQVEIEFGGMRDILIDLGMISWCIASTCSGAYHSAGR